MRHRISADKTPSPYFLNRLCSTVSSNPAHSKLKLYPYSRKSPHSTQQQKDARYPPHPNGRHNQRPREEGAPFNIRPLRRLRNRYARVITPLPEPCILTHPQASSHHPTSRRFSEPLENIRPKQRSNPSSQKSTPRQVLYHLKIFSSMYLTCEKSINAFLLLMSSKH